MEEPFLRVEQVPDSDRLLFSSSAYSALKARSFHVKRAGGRSPPTPPFSPPATSPEVRIQSAERVRQTGLGWRATLSHRPVLSPRFHLDARRRDRSTLADRPDSTKHGRRCAC